MPLTFLSTFQMRRLDAKTPYACISYYIRSLPVKVMYREENYTEPAYCTILSANRSKASRNSDG